MDFATIGATVTMIGKVVVDVVVVLLVIGKVDVIAKILMMGVLM